MRNRLKLYLIIGLLFQVLSCSFAKEQTTIVDIKSPLDNKLELLNKCDNCNIELIQEIRKNSGDSIVIRQLLSCINSDYFLNVEFSEGANYMLFYLLQNSTEITVQLINQDKSYIDRVFILREIENPVLEDINLPLIMKKLKAFKSSQDTQSLVEAIQTAIDKYK